MSTDPTVLSLAELRRALAAASHEHRSVEDALRTERALAERRAIEAAGSVYASLKNEAERTRFLTIALYEDEHYQALTEAEADARAEVESIRADIEIRDDERRDRQMAQRDRELDLKAAEIAIEERKLALDEALNTACQAELAAVNGGLT